MSFPNDCLRRFPMSSPSNAWTRRDVIKAAGASLAVPLAVSLDAAASDTPKPTEKVIGIQIGAVSFVDEGVEQVLDIVQKRAHVNTIFLAVFTYGRGIAGRQIPGQPFPDHGKQESDEKSFRGGNYATPHPVFYQRTVLRDVRAPDHGKLDILEAV